MSDQMMKAIQAQDYGEPGQLKLERVARPEPKANEALVRVKAAGVNPADWKYRNGMYKQFMPLQFPWTPGLEGAGIIEQIGSEVTNVKPGEAVYGFITQSYAEYATVAASDLQPKPASLTFDEAAALPVGAMTAWGALIETAQVQTGQRVLVHGAAGGVGLYVVQLAHWKGAHVIGTASAKNLDFVRSLGAQEVIDYQTTAFEKVVHDVDIVLDTLGGDLPERSWLVLRQGGIYVTVAGRLAEDAGKAHGVRASSARRATIDKLPRVSELIEAKQVKAVVGAVFPLAEAAQAHALSETGHGRGRIVLHIAD